MSLDHIDHILGITIVIVAYGVLWYFVIYSRRIIEKIAGKGLKGLREIRRELGLKKEKDG